MHGSTTRFNHTHFRALTVSLSASFSVFSAPSGSTIALEAFVHSISVAFEGPIAKLVDTMPGCNMQVNNS